MNQYIKEVKKELCLSKKAENELIRDLEEIFASAAEHGDTYEQVIERLGPPEEFALSAQKQMGIDPSGKHKSKSIAGVATALLAAFLCFLLYGFARLQQFPTGAIGGAVAVTGITVKGSGIDLTLVLPVIGSAALIIATAVIVKTVKKKK